jgi:serine protease
MKRIELCCLFATAIVAAAVAPLSGATWHIYADGSGDAPTIKAAVAAAANDSIVVFPGTYNEHDIYVTKRLHIVSVGGTASTIVDAQTSGRCFLFSASTPQIVLKGFTMRHGTAAFDPVYNGDGGAIFARHLANVKITDCVFSNNMANLGGALVARDSSTVSLKRCSFTDNNAIRIISPARAALYI